MVMCWGCWKFKWGKWCEALLLLMSSKKKIVKKRKVVNVKFHFYSLLVSLWIFVGLLCVVGLLCAQMVAQKRFYSITPPFCVSNLSVCPNRCKKDMDDELARGGNMVGRMGISH